jgi:hypothetical protein
MCPTASDRPAPHDTHPRRRCQCGSRARHQHLLELAVPGGCEWDPETGTPAIDCDRHTRYTIARVIVGSGGRWRLCDSCAAQPEFRRLRRRVCVQCGAVGYPTAPMQHKMSCSYGPGHGVTMMTDHSAPNPDDRPQSRPCLLRDSARPCHRPRAPGSEYCLLHGGRLTHVDPNDERRT